MEHNNQQPLPPVPAVSVATSVAAAGSSSSVPYNVNAGLYHVPSISHVQMQVPSSMPMYANSGAIHHQQQQLMSTSPIPCLQPTGLPPAHGAYHLPHQQQHQQFGHPHQQQQAAGGFSQSQLEQLLALAAVGAGVLQQTMGISPGASQQLMLPHQQTQHRQFLPQQSSMMHHPGFMQPTTSALAPMNFTQPPPQIRPTTSVVNVSSIVPSQPATPDDEREKSDVKPPEPPADDGGEQAMRISPDIISPPPSSSSSSINRQRPPAPDEPQQPRPTSVGCVTNETSGARAGGGGDDRSANCLSLPPVSHHHNTTETATVTTANVTTASGLPQQPIHPMTTVNRSCLTANVSTAISSIRTTLPSCMPSVLVPTATTMAAPVLSGEHPLLLSALPRALVPVPCSQALVPAPVVSVSQPPVRLPTVHISVSDPSLSSLSERNLVEMAKRQDEETKKQKRQQQQQQAKLKASSNSREVATTSASTSSTAAPAPKQQVRRACGRNTFTKSGSSTPGSSAEKPRYQRALAQQQPGGRAKVTGARKLFKLNMRSPLQTLAKSSRQRDNTRSRPRPADKQRSASSPSRDRGDSGQPTRQPIKREQPDSQQSSSSAFASPTAASLPAAYGGPGQVGTPSKTVEGVKLSPPSSVKSNSSTTDYYATPEKTRVDDPSAAAAAGDVKPVALTPIAFSAAGREQMAKMVQRQANQEDGELPDDRTTSLRPQTESIKIGGTGDDDLKRSKSDVDSDDSGAGSDDIFRKDASLREFEHSLDFDAVGGSDVSDTDEELLAGPQALPLGTTRIQCASAAAYVPKADRGDELVGNEQLATLRGRFSQLRDQLNTLRALQPPHARPPEPAYLPCTCGGHHSSDSDGGGKERQLSRVDRRRTRRRRRQQQPRSTKHQRTTNLLSDTDDSSSSSSTSSSSSEGLLSSSSDEEPATANDSQSNSRFNQIMRELDRKRGNPSALSEHLSYNEPGQLNDGALCRCPLYAKRVGVRHDIFVGEKLIPRCMSNSNNMRRLHHYRVSITPFRNMSCATPTCIKDEYVFDGYSLFTHEPIPEKMPACHVTRWHTLYAVHVTAEAAPTAFTVGELDSFWEYVVYDLLELSDVQLKSRTLDAAATCPTAHVMPRFARRLPDGGKELLPMCTVMAYLYRQQQTAVIDERTADTADFDEVHGQLVCNPRKRPCTVRLDALKMNGGRPQGVHFGTRPAALTYSGHPEYQKAWKQYIKLKHVLTMKDKLSASDRQRLDEKLNAVLNLKKRMGLCRNVTAEFDLDGFSRTGIYPDMVQLMMLLPLLAHLRYHWSLAHLERAIGHAFHNRALLELAFTHPSYKPSPGINPDHARNALANCGLRLPVYGAARACHASASRKRGITALIDIMSRLGSKHVKASHVTNNERLEYLGDAVIEFLTTVHLFYMFPDLDEGGLATYRSALVQNKNLGAVAQRLNLQSYLLFAHGPDLCHSADLRHALANAFEALLGALFLDACLEKADSFLGEAFFDPATQPQRLHVWVTSNKHPLQIQEPSGDRHWIDGVPALRNLLAFEGSTGIRFTHIRLLAKAMTRRNVPFNFLTYGHNQRLEFLGDSVLQLIVSEYLYKHFPEHHEGHLSLLRSALVNNKTQSVICDDLALARYQIIPPAMHKHQGNQLRLKDKADLVESLLGALYVDAGLQPCKVFCKVCFFPRLKYFIVSQRWNDAKSQLQQCCLTLRRLDGGEPEIPHYRVLGVEGPTNTRIYTCAVYFRRQRLATGKATSVQAAEMCAAERALLLYAHKFPQLMGIRSGGRQRRNRQNINSQYGGGGGGAGYSSRFGSQQQHNRLPQRRPPPSQLQQQQQHVRRSGGYGIRTKIIGKYTRLHQQHSAGSPLKRGAIVSPARRSSSFPLKRRPPADSGRHLKKR